jgi:hypothetical protein
MCDAQQPLLLVVVTVLSAVTFAVCSCLHALQ